jgi:4-hydroxy-tetrahydrodipicolinate synthase
MLSEMGLIQNVLRLPLIPTRLTTMEKISQIVRDLGY